MDLNASSIRNRPRSARIDKLMTNWTRTSGPLAALQAVVQSKCDVHHLFFSVPLMTSSENVQKQPILYKILHMSKMPKPTNPAT